MGKREQILSAAIRVFARQGVERGKIADIARGAGVGKGTVYEYFRSKNALFTAIETTLLEEMLAAADTILSTRQSPAAKLRTFINQSIAQLAGRDEALLIVTELWARSARGHRFEREDSRLAETYREYRRRIVAVLQDGVAGGEFRELNSDGVATLLMAFIDGLAWQFVLLPDQTHFRKIQAEAVDAFLRGIRK